MKTHESLVSIALAFLVGCSDGNSDARVKRKKLTISDQPVLENAKKEAQPREGESVTKLDSGFEYRGPPMQDNPNPPVINLKSGKEIKIRGAGKMYLAQGKPGWMFQYETNIKIDDVPALQKEAEEIWPLLEKDVEKGGYDFATLSANEPPKKTSSGPFSFSNNRGYNFVFEKSASGKWEMTNKKSKDKSEKAQTP